MKSKISGALLIYCATMVISLLAGFIQAFGIILFYMIGILVFIFSLAMVAAGIIMIFDKGDDDAG